MTGGPPEAAANPPGDADGRDAVGRDAVGRDGDGGDRGAAPYAPALPEPLPGAPLTPEGASGTGVPGGTGDDPALPPVAAGRRAMAAYIGELARDRPQVVALAECLCLAAGVEQSLLRRARLRFLPRSTAGLEAELWFSPLVEAAGDRALLLHPLAADVLRERLARGPRAHAEAVRAFTEEAHREATPLVRWFERLLWAGLFPEPDDGPLVDRELRRVLTAVTATGADADDLGRWALHYLPRLPAGVLRHDDAWRIQVASSERLGLEPPADLTGLPRPPAAQARSLVHREVVIGVEARSGGVVLSRPPAPDARPLRATGVWKVRLDAVSALTPAPSHAEPVRLELDDGQRLTLPFTALQRLDTRGRAVLSVARPGTAVETAVATGDLVPGGARYALLLADGTILRYEADGTLRGFLPAEGPRTHLTLSADGSRVACLEGTAVREFSVLDALTPERHFRGRYTVHRMDFTARRQESVRWVVEYGGQLTLEQEDGPDIVYPGVEGAQGVWPLAGLPGAAAVLHHRDRRLKLHTPDRPRGSTLALGVTTVAAHPLRSSIAAATEDGTVLHWSPGEEAPVAIGRAPWPVTALALGADDRLAAVGGDSRLLLWNLTDPEPLPRYVPLEFLAERVLAHPGGGWLVSGSGGPVELTTEDGRRHRVLPARAPADDDPDDPDDWLSDLVLAEIDRSGIPSLFTGPAAAPDRLAAAGVRALVVGPFTPAPPEETDPAEYEEIAALRTEARRHGIRILVDLHPGPDRGGGPDRRGRFLDSARRWLDHGADGIRVSAATEVGEGDLEDLRHLLDGYDNRVLVRRSLEAPHAVLSFDLEDMGALSGVCDMVVPSSLAIALARALHDADLHSYGAQLMDAQFSLESSGLRARWGHCLPELIAPDRRRLAAAVLLALPGSPSLPLDLLRDPEIAALLELRRGHLALSRGDFRAWLFDRPELLGVVRSHGDETVFALANSGTRPLAAPVTSADLGHGGSLRLLDLVDGTTVEAPDQEPVRAVVAGGGVRWFLVSRPAPTAVPGE
ncbi:hypothetical protein ABT354_17350 [Streptomyces sp. NPDC000594]|uniref:hypothetical protein n=1 Tax=Streptomyces sp. NPDC000594 TaxID=3154261 RepID=UPI0033284039